MKPWIWIVIAAADVLALGALIGLWQHLFNNRPLLCCITSVVALLCCITSVVALLCCITSVVALLCCITRVVALLCRITVAAPFRLQESIVPTDLVCPTSKVRKQDISLLRKH